MPLVPSLLHPNNVTIEPKEAASALVDDYSSEIIRGSGRGTEFIIPAQVHWEREKDADPHQQDIVESSTGHITVRRWDAERLGVSLPKRGDRITKLDDAAVRLYIIRTTPLGHYSASDKPTLLRAYFTDREPTG